MIRLFSNLTWLVLAAALAARPSTALAQDAPIDAPPKPVGKVLIPLPRDENADQSAPVELLPDNRPLTGIEQLSIGTSPERHSYWVPGFSYTNFVQSNAQLLGGGNGWNSTSYFVGNVSLLQNWSRSQLALNYSGGGSLSTDSFVQNGQYHQLAANQLFNFGRWQLTLLDQFAYLPASQFGFGAGSSLALPGSGGPLAPTLPGLQPGLGAGQSLFTSTGPQYTNSAGAQVNYMLTSRSSVTMGGIYGVQRFIDAGSIESNTILANFGYNYQISRTDTLGVVYRFSSFHYLGNPQAIGDHSAQVAYGRKLTGRLALQLSGGVERNTFRIPIAGKTGRTDASISAGLSYGFARGGVSLHYSHGTSGGGGVLLGAKSDRIDTSATRQLSRVLRGNLGFGFARNTSLESAPGTPSNDFNQYFFSAGLARPLGRSVDVTLSYNANIETSNQNICTPAVCQSTYTTHQINFGFSWRARPIVIP